MLGTMRPLPQEGLGVCVRKLPLARIVLQKAQHAFGHVGRGDWAHDEAAVNLKLLPLHAVRDGASLSNDFAAIMQKLGTTGDYPYVGGYLAKISSGTGYTSAWAELRVGYTIFVPLKPTLWSMKVAGADIAIRNGEILQVPANQQTIAAQQPTAHCAKFADTRGMERTACFFVFLHSLAVAEMQRLCSCKTHFA